MCVVHAMRIIIFMIKCMCLCV